MDVFKLMLERFTSASPDTIDLFVLFGEYYKVKLLVMIYMNVNRLWSEMPHLLHIFNDIFLLHSRISLPRNKLRENQIKSGSPETLATFEHSRHKTKTNKTQNRTQHRKLKRLATWPHQKPGGGEPVQLTLILFFVWLDMLPLLWIYFFFCNYWN